MRAWACAEEAQALAFGFQRIAGVDEAGRGPWAGPVVASAVILNTPRVPVPVDDSKRLTPLQRRRAFEVILRHADVGVGIVSAEEIDRRNILQATFLAMQHAVTDLPEPPDCVLVDGSLAPSVPMPCRPLVRGDQRSYVIACASIVAKVVRDRLMEFYHELYPQYHFHRHKGYGTALHARLLHTWGPSVLHRFTFQPVADTLAPTGPAAARPHPSSPPQIVGGSDGQGPPLRVTRWGSPDHDSSD